MKIAAWIAVGYLVVVGGATFVSGASTNSPTADQIASLPSAGSLLGSSGTSAAALDLGAAAGLWWFLLR